MDKLIPSFEKSLFDTSFEDAGIDILEIGIDSILDNDILASIPICKLVIGTAKTAQNVHDRNMLRQTIAFIRGFNSGNMDEEKLNNVSA